MIYHGSEGLADLRNVVASAVTDLKPVAGRFDSIACTGLSGVAVGVPVSLALDRPVVIVRKPGDAHHGSSVVENVEGMGDKFLFLDDFISLGETARLVVGQLESLGGKHAGTYLYAKRILRMHSYKLRIRNSVPELVCRCGYC